jgi:RNA-directed DNA polymerase
MRRADYARVFARAMLEGPWFPSELATRLEQLVGMRRPWMVWLVAEVCEQFPEPPEEEVLAGWLCSAQPRDESEHAEDEYEDENEHEDHRTDEALIALPATDLRLVATVFGAPTIRRWPLGAPEMRESPWSVPALATTGELARWLGVDLLQLVTLADRRQIARNAKNEPWRHYRYRWVKKRSGGQRLIEAPKPRLRTIQRYLLDDVIARIPPHEACHGFRAGRSVRTFAAPHVGRDVVVRLDLQSFFASVFASRVVATLRMAGYPAQVSRTIAALCTHATPLDVLAAAPNIDELERMRLRTRHLPQGAPTSGALANLAAYRFDVRVDAFARALGATYTRYADDLALSGSTELARNASSAVARIAAIAHDEGFAINFRKTRVMVRAGRQRVAGVVVNDKLAVSRVEVDRLRAILHNCIRSGPSTQNCENHADFRAHLLGRISWVASLDAAKGQKLMARFAQIPWT